MVGKCDAKQSLVKLTILQLDWHTDQLATSHEFLVAVTDVLLGTTMFVHAVMPRLREGSILRHSDQALNLRNHLIWVITETGATESGDHWIKWSVNQVITESCDQRIRWSLNHVISESGDHWNWSHWIKWSVNQVITESGHHWIRVVHWIMWSVNQHVNGNIWKVLQW